MLFLSVLALISLPFCSAASKDPQHAELIALAASNKGVIHVDSPKTFDLLTSPKRHWSASIQLTALDKSLRCAPCREFDPTFAAVGKAWSTVPETQRDSHFFATLDFKEGSEIFRQLGLNTAPVVYFYPAAEGPRAPENGQTDPTSYDLSGYGFEAEALVNQLNRHMPVPIPYRAPIDWAKVGTYVALTLVALLSARFAWPILTNRWTWAVGTIVTSLIMTSGYMFTRIRGSPYTGHDGGWIAPGYQNQYGQEVHVVAALYGSLALCFIMLTVVAPNQTSEKRQRAQVYLWSIVTVVLFSILLSLFRVKNQGYPFRLLL